MSFATLERLILKNARVELNNPKLRLTDLLEWSTGDVKPQDESEIILRITNPRVNICVKKTCDKRPL